jgi:hypothetical protein
MNNRLANDSPSNELKKWALMGSLYRKFGISLIYQHPKAYFKHFVRPNLIYFYTPKIELLSEYNNDKEKMEKLAFFWFGLKMKKESFIKNNSTILIMDVLRIVNATINLILILSFTGIIILGSYKKLRTHVKTILILVFIFWIFNFLFSVFAAPISIRHQIFPMTISFTFGFLLATFFVQQCGMFNSREVATYVNQEAIT